MFELFSSFINPTKDGTVFDSSAARNAPFGPFVHGRGQIIQVFICNPIMSCSKCCRHFLELSNHLTWPVRWQSPVDRENWLLVSPPSYHNLLPTTGTCSYHQPQPDTNEHCQIQYGTTQPGLHGHIDWTMPGREMADGGKKKPQTIKHQV